MLYFNHKHILVKNIQFSKWEGLTEKRLNINYASDIMISLLSVATNVIISLGDSTAPHHQRHLSSISAQYKI